MKVWVIGRSYPEPGNNMTGSFELEQAKMLQKYGEEVCYLCCSLHPAKKIKSWGYKSWNENNVQICTFSTHFAPRIFPFYFLKLRCRIWRDFLKRVADETGRPDIIHIHYPAMLMIADALEPFKQAGVKIIATEHWTKVLSKSLDTLEVRAYKRYFDIISAFICVGSPLAEVVKKTVGKQDAKILVVPNVVEQEFRPSDETHSGFEFIAVGRLVKIKQFDKIIQAFSECFRGKEAKLTIIGGGDEFDFLSKMIADLSMENQITLTGSLPRNLVAKRISNADCLVCYSRFETFGVPIVEAWACGVPTTTTTAAAVIDNFDNRLGVEVSYDDIEELKTKLVYMYDNIALFDKKFISDYAKEHFSEPVIYQRLKDIYMES